jgi:citrate lyase subunit beta/citryl-CoA lyase
MTLIRSWLFVPGDSESKLAKGRNSVADALILDLEDSVADQRESRNLSGKFLIDLRSFETEISVRINPWITSSAAISFAVHRLITAVAAFAKCTRPAKSIRWQISFWLLRQDGIKAGKTNPVGCNRTAHRYSFHYLSDLTPRLTAAWGGEVWPRRWGTTTQSRRALSSPYVHAQVMTGDIEGDQCRAVGAVVVNFVT